MNNKGIGNYLNQYIAFVVSYTVVGSEGFDNPHLVKTFLKFNEDAVNGIGLSLILPSFLRNIATRPIEKNYSIIRISLLPIIQK